MRRRICLWGVILCELLAQYQDSFQDVGLDYWTEDAPIGNNKAALVDCIFKIMDDSEFERAVVLYDVPRETFIINAINSQEGLCYKSYLKFFKSWLGGSNV
jgi:hypothetical protein